MSSPYTIVFHTHADLPYVDKFVTHFSVAGRKSILIVVDVDVPQSFENVHELIENAAVAIVMISADMLASEAFVKSLMPQLLNRHDRGLRLFPVILRACAWTQVGWLRRLQVFPNSLTALAHLDSAEREAVFAELVYQVVSAWEEVVAREDQLPPSSAVLVEESAEQSAGTGKPVFFISHCREDGDFAEVLKSRLEAHGYKAWIDIERLNPGEDWRQGIDDGIARCTAVIVVMSPTARNSEYVTYEWAFAVGRGILVVPIMLHQTPLHPRLETIQYLDFTNRAARPWSRLMEVLEQACQAEKTFKH